MMLPRPKDAMRGMLALLLIATFTATLWALFMLAIPEGNRDTLTYMLGQLSGMVTTALAFYFATTKSSADKNELISRAQDGPREVEVTNPPEKPVPVDVPEPTFGDRT